MRRLSSAFLLVCGLLLAACSGGGSPSSPPTSRPTATPTGAPTATPTPTPTATPTPAPAATRLYVVYETTHANYLDYFTWPLDASSTPTASIGIGYANGQSLAVDPSGNLYSSNAGAIAVYAPPTSVLTTRFSLTTTFENTGIALDSSGNLYAASASGSLYEATAPLSSASTFRLLFASGLGNSESICFDNSQNLYAANHSGTLNVLAPPYTASSGSVVVNSGGGVFDCAYDATTNQLAITVVDFPTEVLIYNLPITQSSTPVATLPVLGPVAFDKSGNMYLNGPLGGIGVYSPPFTSASTPIYTIPTTNQFSAITFGS